MPLALAVGAFVMLFNGPCLLGARHIRKMFQDVCERAGLGRD